MDEPPANQQQPAAAQKDLLNLLASQNWEEVLSELLSFTVSRIQSRFWLAVWGGHLPGAIEAHDIIMESVVDIINGVRHADESVALVPFLKQVIKSKISHLAWSAENRHTRRLDPCPDDREMDKEIAAQKPRDPFVETDVVSKETEQINTQLLDLLIEELSDDADLQKIIECNIDGIFKREEIATRLGKTVSDITNMKKRLDRRLLAFTAKYADRNPYLEERK